MVVVDTMSNWTKNQWLNLYTVAHDATMDQALRAYAANPDADPRMVNPEGYDGDKAGTGLPVVPYVLPDWVPQIVKDNPLLWAGGAVAVFLLWWNS
jgi:hypothetical protein